MNIIAPTGYAWHVSVDPPHSRPPEVADLRLDPLLDASDELAKSWLFALLEARPLERAPEISLARFARDAPELCAATLQALRSDAELDRLRAHAHRGDAAERDWDLRALAGVADTPAAVDAVEALRAVLWRALTDALPDFVLTAAGRLANRLAHVCLTLIARDAADHPRQSAPSLQAQARASQAPDAPPYETDSADEEEEEERLAPVREHDEYAAEENDRAPRIEMQRMYAGAREGPELDDPWAIDTPEPLDDATCPEDVSSEIERRSGEGERFVVLLIEVVGFERLRDAEGTDALDELLSAVQRALSDTLGPAERLAAEGAGRWWLVARGARADEGRALAELLARSVSAAVAHRHVPLKIAIGVAASPEDGHEAAELAERAEEELYAARAAGLCVLPAGIPRPAAAAPVTDR